CIGFVGRRILATPDAGVMLQGQFADLGEVQRRRLAERHAATLGADLVLEDEASRSALAQPKPESRNIIVEENGFSFVRRQLCRAHHRRCQLHGDPPSVSATATFWEDHGKILYDHPSPSLPRMTVAVRDESMTYKGVCRGCPASPTAIFNLEYCPAAQ